jgi:hypothetical protein
MKDIDIVVQPPAKTAAPSQLAPARPAAKSCCCAARAAASVKADDAGAAALAAQACGMASTPAA